MARTGSVDLGTIVWRSPMEGTAETYSGASLERAGLADGRRLVLKHLPAAGDWLGRATGGLDRTRLLWDAGVLAWVAPVVDHTVLDVIDAGDHDIVVMRDASDVLLPPNIPVDRDRSRRLLAGLAAMHRRSMGDPTPVLCSIGARYAMFRPAFHAGDTGPDAHPSREWIVAGWDHFAEQAPDDVAEAVFAVHRDPGRLGSRLEQFPATLLHGDAKLANLGLGPSGLVAVDWGELTGFGPVEVDVAWYAVMNTWRISTTPTDLFADYEEVSGRRLDPEVLDLACVGSLAQMGMRFAATALAAPVDETRARAAELLAWWTIRVREALDRLGSV